MKNLLFAFALGSAFTLFTETSSTRAGDLIISEFMAGNASSIADEDGDFSDWVEVFNSGNSTLSLEGWYLTDTAKNLKKWQFPAVEVSAGRPLLVFASEKNRADPARQLHTNFKLGTQGQYLALVRPNGTSLEFEFAPVYPKQVDDVSYGVAMDSASSLLVTSEAPAKFLVPVDGSLGLSWTEAAFDDSSWTAATLGIGYDRKTRTTYDSLIKTDVRLAMDGISSSAYLRVPFTVGDPSSVNSLLLRMKYDDGFVAYLNGKEVARRNAAASLSWNSKASAPHLDSSAIVFEQFNISTQAASLVEGANVLAIQGLNDNPKGNDFLIVPELEAIHVNAVHGGSKQYFDEPTPGWVNSTGAPGIADEAQYSHESGTYSAPITLTLTASSPAAVIHYTVDRSPPTEASPVYLAPISIENTTVVRTKVFQPGLIPSPSSTRTYVELDPSVSDFSSNLPLVIINNFSRAISEDPRTPVHLGIMDVDKATGRSTLTSTPSFIGNAGIKIRGSSSLQFPKKSYSVELWDERNSDVGAPILGFPKESDWILYAPYTDKTLMRDVLAYEWSNNMGRFAVHTRFVELFLSPGPTVKRGDYQGVYVFMEKIKRGHDRVDIHRLDASQTEEPEISGGYILKIDRLDPGDSGFTTKGGRLLAWVYPKEREATAAQKAYIKGYMDQFETALNGQNFKDPNVGYEKYIDVDSFIDQHILVELTKNIDGFRLSTFMFKDREGKLQMGPAWDFNLTLGNANYLDGWKPEGWYHDLISGADYAWWPRLFQDPAFVQRYRARWAALRPNQFSEATLLASVDGHAQLLAEAQVRNYQRWHILGTYVWPNQFIGKTFDEELGFMRGWIKGRVAWIDSQFVAAPKFAKDGGSIDPGFALTMTAPAGTILYTLNQSDPRLADGGISPNALTYTGPVILNENTRVRARVSVGAMWSTLKEATFVVAPPPLTITEIMYHPQDPAPEGTPYRAEDFEFVELENTGAAPMSLTGVRFTSGITFDFTGSPVTSLGPGEYVLVVKNLEAFKSRYHADGLKIAGEFPRNLSNARATFALLGALDEPILRFAYDSAWYPDSNGGGYSLVLVDDHGPRESWGTKESWRTSTNIGGSPGAADAGGTPGGLQLPGDANQDGQFNLSDAISILRRLAGGAPEPPPCDGATIAEGANVTLLDLDGNAQVNITDAIQVLNYLFKEGPPPALGRSCVRITGCPSVCVQ